MDVTSTASAGSGATSAQRKSFSEDYQFFLKMLTTQLQYQDPLDPMDSSEYTQQLVSYTQVEQAIAQNEKLDSIISALGAQQLNQATSLLGTEVTVASSASNLDEDGASWVYDLEGEADETVLRVFDQKGKEVWSGEGGTEAGLHNFTWNGEMADGTAAPPGIYDLTVTPKTEAGVAVAVNTFMRDRVSAIEISGGESLLKFGELGVPMQLVVLVENQTDPQ